VTLTSGLSGVFSGFAPLAKRAAERFGVDVRDILVELGEEKWYAGRKISLLKLRLYLKQKKEGKPEDFQLESFNIMVYALSSRDRSYGEAISSIIYIEIAASR